MPNDHYNSIWIGHFRFIPCLLTLTAAIVTKYYWENASGAIASSREHLNVQENAGRAATHGGLACRVMGLVCERSADRNLGEPPHYCSPYFASDRLFWLWLLLKNVIVYFEIQTQFQTLISIPDCICTWYLIWFFWGNDTITLYIWDSYYPPFSYIHFKLYNLKSHSIHNQCVTDNHIETISYIEFVLQIIERLLQIVLLNIYAMFRDWKCSLILISLIHRGISSNYSTYWLIGMANCHLFKRNSSLSLVFKCVQLVPSNCNLSLFIKIVCTI